MTVHFLCFVRGCRDRGIVGTRHRYFGHVVSCGAHDPRKHGYDCAFTDAPGATRDAPVARPAGEGGTKVVQPVPPPTLPPTPARQEIEF